MQHQEDKHCQQHCQHCQDKHCHSKHLISSPCVLEARSAVISRGPSFQRNQDPLMIHCGLSWTMQPHNGLKEMHNNATKCCVFVFVYLYLCICAVLNNEYCEVKKKNNYSTRSYYAIYQEATLMML